MILVSASTAPADTWASSSGPIDDVDRVSFARTESCWNAPAGTCSIGS
jgi:hypothetical protein